jgi:tetratricopeptide (TPR) repeat protein/predicted Ser/Thr protein kinase
LAIRPRFLQDPQRLAEDYVRRGDFSQALEQYRKAGLWAEAARLALDLKNEEELVRCSLMAALGRIPAGYEDAGTIPAAELLVSQRRHALAIPLFEMAWDLPRAAECALAVGDPLRAARLYERAGARLDAARCYQKAGKPREALHLLEEGSKTTPGGTSVPPGRTEEMIVLRLDLLRQLGRDSAAVALLSSTPPSPRVASLLEGFGRLEDAIECHLALGDAASAARVAAQCPDRDRQMARIHLRSGRAVEAGDLFARLGLSREAAEAYEAGLDWARAAYRWEAAGEPWRAGEAYEKGGRLADAARCFVKAGLPERAAGLSARKPARAATPPPSRPGKTLETAARLLAAGDKTRAASLLLGIQPGDADFAQGALLLAPLLLEEGFHDEALRRLVQLPRDAERLYWEGRTHESLGDAEAARSGYEQALALDPRHAGARERLRGLLDPPAPRGPSATLAVAESGSWIEAIQPAPAPGFTPGQRLADRYDIQSQIGRGGMGRVYKAYDLELSETVAIKTLIRPTEEGGADETRLLREVQLCRRISHPNVVRVYDVGRFPGGLFITMEHLEGSNLDRVIAEGSPLPFDRIRAILSEIAEGLREAHALGILHRDLKPANIMVTPARVKILDFGIACVQGRNTGLTQAGFVVGSPSYMSPDQLQGLELDGRSDLYSLGILAYTLIAGREPFEHEDPLVLALQQIREAPPDIRGFRPETPDAWVAFLDRLVAKSPEDRFPSAQAVLNALRELPLPAPEPEPEEDERLSTLATPVESLRC